jgi:outer membrane lipoprotein carrier protein
MKKTLYTLFLLIGIIHSSPSIGLPKPDAQAKKAIASIRMPTSFQADFIYTHIHGDTKQKDTQEEYQIEGKIWVKGNKYRLVLENQIVVSNGETIWNYDFSLKEVQIYHEQTTNTDRDMTSFSPIQLLHLYEQGFVPIALHTTIVDQKNCKVVALMAQEEKSDIKHLNLVIDQETHQIKSMQVLEKDGTVHNFSIVNLVIQAKLKDSYFEFQMPAEPIEVVDLR